MTNVKRIISVALMTIFATALIGCNMIEKTPEGIAKTVVAKVYDDKVTRGDVDEQLDAVIDQIVAQYGENYKSNAEAMEQLAEQKTQVLEGIIVEKIIIYKAKELKVMPTEAKLNEEINKQLEEIKKSLGTDEKYKEALEQAKITEDLLKVRIKPSVIQDALYNEITKDVKVDAAQEKVYYTDNLVQFTEKPNKIQVSHILVATEAEAIAAKKRIDAGEAFETLVKEVSTDEASKEAGGDLGLVEYSNTQIDKTFMTAAIATPKGEVSAPVQTGYGWHLIKAIEKEEYPVKKFEDVKEEIQKILMAQGKEKVWTDSMKKWQEEGKITKYENKL